LLLQILLAQQTLIEKYIKLKNFFQLIIKVKYEILLKRKPYFILILFYFSTLFAPKLIIIIIIFCT
jgi:hypothetical protein